MRKQGERRLQAGFKGGKVAIVDPYQRGPRLSRDVQLCQGVDLHQRVQRERCGQGMQVQELERIEGRGDE